MKKSNVAIIKVNTVGILERHPDFYSCLGLINYHLSFLSTRLNDNHLMLMIEEAEIREITEFTEI